MWMSPRCGRGGVAIGIDQSEQSHTISESFGYEVQPHESWGDLSNLCPLYT